MLNLAGSLLVAAFLVGNTLKPSFISPDIRLSFADIAVALIWLLVLATRFRSVCAALRSSPLVRPVVAFFVIGFLSLLVSGREYGPLALLVGFLYLVRWEVYALFFLPLTLLFPRSAALKLLRYLGLALIITSLGQYLLLPDLRPLTAAGWDPHYYRVVGTLLDPGFTGLLLVFALLQLTPQSGPIPLFYSLSWAASYAALALTYSRSSFLAFLSGIFSLAVKRQSFRFFSSAVLLIAVTLIVLPRAPNGEGVKLERTSTIQARLTNWAHSLIIFKDHPFWGVGFDTYRYAQKSYGFISGPDWQVSHAGAGADSSLLFVAATTGILGLAAYSWYLKRLWAASAGNLAFRAGLVALFFHSWFLNSLFYPFILIWLSLWIASGVESHH